jgi:hypothetical protein
MDDLVVAGERRQIAEATTTIVMVVRSLDFGAFGDIAFAFAALDGLGLGGDTLG